MERLWLTKRVTVLHGAVNCGLVTTEEGLLVIDTGLDRSAANKILRAAEELGCPVRAVLNTYAHADHFGGNAQLVRKTGAPVHAPAGEADVIRQPLYEPVYLFGGAVPIAALRHRFLLAESSPVHHEAQPGQVLEWGGVRVQVVDLAAALEVVMGDPVAYVLNRTALLGVLATLEREGAVRVEVRDGRWWWTAA